jgi:Dolichyl-phosphate-mannose-protein mannosyltransferase
MAVQETLRNIDSGLFSRILKIGMITFLIIGLCLVYFMVHFKGLGTEAAMDQAQIARSLVSGEGFSTRYIRPLAISQLGDSGKKIPAGNFPEMNNAPLSPILEAVALFPIRHKLDMTPTDILGLGDRVIAVEGTLLLLLGVFVWYLVAKNLFDQSLALLAAGLILVTDLLWQYALAGLPQHLLIILFGTLTLCAVKARQAEENEKTVQVIIWLAVCGLLLGLMSLAHGVAAFMVPGFLVFCLLGFHDRIIALLLPLIVYLLTILPWLVHNYLVCGNPLGISIYAALAGAGISPQSVMRGSNTGLVVGLGMATKFRSGLLDQAAHLWEYLGLNITVVAFLPALLHSYRNPTAGLWRWIVALMWLGMTLGMTFFGVKEPVSGNQLHIVFQPVFITFGLAFILVLWNRLGISSPPLRIAFLSILFLMSGTPMLLTLLAGQPARIQWPPYVPPFIAVLEKWFQPKEVLCSDMPWAVAWYANRKCLLLPDTVHALDEISDYNALGSPVVGLYLTPVSGNQDFLSLMKGPDKDWGPVIMRTINLNDFLLKCFTPLPVDGECILYADTERWMQKTK